MAGGVPGKNKFGIATMVKAGANISVRDVGIRFKGEGSRPPYKRAGCTGASSIF